MKRTCTAWKCTRQASPGFKRCKPCRMHVRALAHEIAVGRRRKRLCVCGRERAPGRKTCRPCLDYHAARAAELEETRRLDGFCPKCGGSRETEHVRCRRCRARDREHWARMPKAKRKRMRRERRARNPEPVAKVAVRVAACKARWRAAGRCVACGKPAARKADGTLAANCRHHLQLKAAVQARKRQETQRHE